MSKTLFMTCSMTLHDPRGSISTTALKRFKKYYVQSHPEDVISELNLNTLRIANISLNSENFAEFFADPGGDEEINRLKNLDKLVMASPMTNFNYPAVLKNYLDHILVAKKTFIYKYDGKGISEGLLKNLKVQIITSQGASFGWYPFGNHTETLRGTWNFVGAKVSRPILLAGTKTPEQLKLPAKTIVDRFDSELKEGALKF